MAVVSFVTAIFSYAQERVPVCKVSIPLSTQPLPLSVDNSKSPYFPPIIDQIGGSCAQASYIGHMFTYEMNRLLGRNASESEHYRYSYLYTWNFINEGKDQGSLGYEGLSIAMANGIMSVADYPKSSSVYSYYWASGYDKYYRAMANRVKTLQIIDLQSAEDLSRIKRYLYDHGVEGSKSGGVVTFSSRSIDWKFDNNYSGPSQTGYKSLLTRLATEGGHAMTIVGYDDLVEFLAPDGTLSKGAFIVVNSWGTWSHDNGRYYLPYWFFFNREYDGKVVSHNDLSTEVCGIDVEYREPSITFCVSVECDARNNLSFSMGVSPYDANESLVNHVVHIANYQGGGYNMCGQYADSKIEMGFDCTSMERFLNEMEKPSFFLTINRNKRDGKSASVARLLSFSVIDYRESRTNPKIYRYTLPSGQKGGVDLKSGVNLFRIDTVEPKSISRSDIPWIGKSGNPTTSPLVFRTADGKYAKVRVLEYDKSSGELRFKYVYSPSGDNNIR